MPTDSNSDMTTRRLLRAGDKLLHYSIVGPIGGGGMGDVFLAQDAKLDRLVALKTISSKVVEDPRSRQRLISEAKASARLNHRNICSIYAIEEYDGNVFIIMEYVQGNTLSKFVADKPADIESVYNIGKQCCEGLQAAHDEGIVHRDIKSSNIMFDKYGTVKIMDFGIAKIVNDASATASSTITGTFQYMSPEQVSGKSVDARSDLFSLGVVLYELLSGELPFDADNIAALAYKLIHDQPTLLTARRKEIPEGLQSIVFTALAKEASQRYQSAAEMLKDLSGDGGGTQNDRIMPISPGKTICVFPFRNLSAQPDDSYISEGIREEIISALSRVPQLNVTSRSALPSLQKEGNNEIAVARKLNVTSFLEGSFRRQGDSVRLLLQLTDVHDGIVSWTQQFDRKVEDLFTLQSDIAHRVAAALNIEFAPESLSTSPSLSSVHPDAHDLYLRGQFHLKKRDHSSVRTAVTLLSEAVRIDDSFAAAYGELSVASGICDYYGIECSDRPDQSTFDLANRALELDPSSSQAHMSLFFLLRNVNIRRAISELRTAIALDENNAEAYHLLAHSYAFFGHYRSAEHAALRAVHLDPFHEMAEAHLVRLYFFTGQEQKLKSRMAQMTKTHSGSHVVHSNLGWLEWCRHNWENALKQLEKSVEIEPASFRDIDRIGDCYLKLKKPELGISVLESGIERNNRAEMLFARLGQLFASLDEHKKSEEMFETAMELILEEARSKKLENTAIDFFNRAWIAALQENSEVALANLKRAVDKGYGHYAELRVRPDWDTLRNTQEFGNLIEELARVKTKEDSK